MHPFVTLPNKSDEQVYGVIDSIICDKELPKQKDNKSDDESPKQKDNKVTDHRDNNSHDQRLYNLKEETCKTNGNNKRAKVFELPRDKLIGNDYCLFKLKRPSELTNRARDWLEINKHYGEWYISISQHIVFKYIDDDNTMCRCYRSQPGSDLRFWFDINKFDVTPVNSKGKKSSNVITFALDEVIVTNEDNAIIFDDNNNISSTLVHYIITKQDKQTNTITVKYYKHKRVYKDSKCVYNYYNGSCELCLDDQNKYNKLLTFNEFKQLWSTNIINIA